MLTRQRLAAVKGVLMPSTDRSPQESHGTEEIHQSPPRAFGSRVFAGCTYTLLLVEALARLLLFDLLNARGYARVHSFTKRTRVTARRETPDTVARICDAVEEACVWYVKRAYCLQRSAVATWMLRSRGIDAVLVIGYRPVPVQSHAWVEVNGTVVNDRPQYQKFFRVVDRL